MAGRGVAQEERAWLSAADLDDSLRMPFVMPLLMRLCALAAAVAHPATGSSLRPAPNPVPPNYILGK